MGFFWLTCTLLAECLGYVLRYIIGMWFSQYLLKTYALLPISRVHPVTPSQVAWGFVVLGLLMHIYIIARQLPRPQLERVQMRPRQPSKREVEQVEKAYKHMEQKATINRALPFHHPQRFRIYQGEGYTVRFVGSMLLIDVALFQTTGSSYLQALLAHALWYYNSSDLRVRRLLDLFPHESNITVGFTGRFVTWIGWQFYKRFQVYRADEYATRLGQKHALIQTLEELFLPLDMPRGHYFYDVPYVESRIDRLHDYP
jgi:hypothetical protein